MNNQVNVRECGIAKTVDEYHKLEILSNDIAFNNFLKENYIYNPNTGCIFNKRINRICEGSVLFIKINYNGKRVSLSKHRLVWFLYYNEWPEGFIHHINDNKKDNRINNLTIINNSQSKMNKRKTNKLTSSIYKGVCFHKNRLKYIAAIEINRKKIHIGYFNSEELAAKAYDQKAIELFGEHARLNFPNKNNEKDFNKTVIELFEKGLKK